MRGESVETPTGTIASTRLPRPTSTFIGRTTEIGDIVGLVRGGARLVTLTGSGGSGKTRLAIEAAAEVGSDFPDATHWLNLAQLRDARLVLPTMADALGRGGDLAAAIGDARLLVVLDNFEQLVSAAPDVCALLETCPNLFMLITSRELLGVPGEVQYGVPPLPPSDAVALFCGRSGLTADDTIAELCGHLDNLPLAVELAAARTRVLSPAQILARLSERLDLLRASRGVEPRQRTLRAAIEWSCQLLEPDDLTLFARLAVFPGGCTLEGAEQVADAEVDGLQSLVDKNLLRHSDERFWMLETIREYASALFAELSDEEQVRSRHVEWCIRFIETSEQQLVTGRAETVRDIQQEFANVRSAFHWCLATGRIAEALRLVRPRVFWQSVQTHAVEGREWMEAVLARSHGVEPALRSRVLATAGDLLRVACELDEATTLLEEAFHIDTRLGNPAALAETAYALGRVLMAAGRYQEGAEVSGSGLAAARDSGDGHLISELSAQLAELTYRLGDSGAAAALADEALDLARSAADLHSEGDALRVLAMTSRDSADLDLAREHLHEALGLMRSLSDSYCISLLLTVLGDVELRGNRTQAARAAFVEALEHQRAIAQWRLAADSLWGVGAAELATGHATRAAVLLAAEEALRSRTGAFLQATSADRYAAVHQTVKERLTASELAAARRQGAAMTAEETVEFASGVPGATPTSPAPASAPTADSLLRREGEYWTVAFDGETFRLKDAKGLRYLDTLLRNPGREFHVLDLVQVTEGRTAAPSRRDASDAGATTNGFGSTGPVLDSQAKTAYRVRLGELEHELDEAVAWSDTARTAKLRAEIEFLTDELSAAFGLHGRDRTSSTAAERARVNVTRAIRSVVQRIHTHHLTLGEHLDATVHTGTFCSYTPDPRPSPTGPWTS